MKHTGNRKTSELVLPKELPDDLRSALEQKFTLLDRVLRRDEVDLVEKARLIRLRGAVEGSEVALSGHLDELRSRIAHELARREASRQADLAIAVLGMIDRLVEHLEEGEIARGRGRGQARRRAEEELEPEELERFRALSAFTAAERFRAIEGRFAATLDALNSLAEAYRPRGG